MERWPKLIRPGQTVVETVLVMGLASLLLPALLTGWVAAREGRAQQQQRTAAAALLTEALEATRIVRDNGWTGFAINGVWHPEIAGTTWTLAPNPEQILGFNRSITISDVYRDGEIDPSIKQVDAQVSWNSPLPNQVTATTYLSRHDNLVFTHTTEADFLAGSLSGVTVTNSAGGEVILSSGGTGSWCEPALTIATLDLPKNGVANALTAIEGQAFAGTGDNASGVSYATVELANTSPPSSSITSTFDGYKTNDVFGEENYAYLATDNNAKEIEIIDLSANPAVEAGYFDSAGPDDANAVVVSASVGYMTSGNTLYLFDLTAKTGSRPQLGNVSLAGPGTEIAVNGGYAYVSILGSPELQIVDVSNPAAPTIVGQADTDSAPATDVFINDTATRAYLATRASASQAEMFIIDVTGKSGQQPVLGSYEANGTSAKGITVVTGNKAIFVGNGGEEYQVIDITNESVPSRCGGVEIDTGVNGVASVLETDGDAYSYIITGDANAEFRIIAGGPGGQYASAGTYESATYDPGYPTAFNRLIPMLTEPAGTSVTFQVAVADPVAGSCQDANFVFVGPDGTASTFYDDAGAISYHDDGVGYENPGQCFRYRAYLSTTSSSSTPVFTQISVNYSP